MPLVPPSGMTDELNVIEQVRLCFYLDGWNGPGMYECGYRHRHGEGWHGRREEGREYRGGDRREDRRYPDRPTLGQATELALSTCREQAKRPEACGVRLTFCADGSHRQ